MAVDLFQRLVAKAALGRIHHTLEGQIAVVEVIFNRRDSGRYPDTVCGVVGQGSSRGCQFSYTCDDIPDRVRAA